MLSKDFIFSGIFGPCVRGFSRIFFDIRIHGVENLPNNKAVMLACNHQSYLDAPILGAFLPGNIKFITWYLLFKQPILGKILELHEDIPIAPRTHQTVIDAAILRADKIFKKQGSICIFPEGHLTKTGDIDVFKTGIVLFWEKSRPVIVPIAISGFWNTPLSRNKTISLMSFFIKRTRLMINIGEPIEFDQRFDLQLLEQSVRKLYLETEFTRLLEESLDAGRS